MKKIVTFGEIMLRLSPPGFQRFVQAKGFDAFYGGGEANVAFSLSQYGLATSYVTKLPKNPLGQAAANELRRFGVNIDSILWDKERLGIYFCEKGASMRPSIVVYDRADSSIAKATKGDFDWKEIFEDAQWFHFTGITPALGPNVAEICLEACQVAKELGVKISCDLNFRKNLWTSAEAKETMTKLMPYVDILVANEEDAEKVFGIKAENTNVEAGSLDVEGYKTVADKLISSFDLEKVAITLRESISASDNGWSGILYDGKQFYQGPKYTVRIVDRVGGGDSFCAGLIYSLISGYEPQEAIDFAVAASALKHTIEGDFNVVEVEEVRKLMKGDASGRVQR
ncbi:MAG: PfkB domain protein [Clostridiales bacterium 38_11]|nr:MAG: PfkB domain protein [Clostridiales bacterium 38_11]HBH13349.1 2-dehydro-3-deoxygluconokinase [Clostridiales bacterium]